jgi:transposase
MLRLLKSGESTNLGEAAETLGYSRRQCQRWFLTYKREGLEELLLTRVHERGPRELITQEAFEELEEAMKRGEIATISQAHRFLSHRERCRVCSPRERRRASEAAQGEAQDGKASA